MATSKENISIEEWVSRTPIPSQPLSEIAPAWQDKNPASAIDEALLFHRQHKKSLIGHMAYYASAAAVASIVMGGILFSNFDYKKILFSTSIKQADKVAVVIKIQGKARLIAVNGQSRAISKGQAIPELAEITTESDGIVDLSLPAGVLVRIAPDSSYRIAAKDKNKPGLVKTHLNQGKVYSLVEKLASHEGFEVSTPTAIAGVRGTSFSIKADAAKTEIQMVQGSVEVSSRNQSDKRTWQVDQYDKNFIQIQKTGAVEHKQNIQQDFQDARQLDDLGRLLENSESRSLVLDQVALKRTLAVKKERQQLYSIIRLKNGSTVKGLIVAQTGQRLFVETAQKSRVIYANEVAEIKFLDE